MIISKYSAEVEFPRKKYILTNMSELLQKKTIDPPQVTLSLKLFQKAHDIFDHPLQQKTMSSGLKKRTSLIIFQQYRAKSSIRDRNNLTTQKKPKQSSFYEKIKLSSSIIANNKKKQYGKNIEVNYRSTSSLPQKLFSNQALNKKSHSFTKSSIINLQINEKNPMNQKEFAKRPQSIDKHYLSSKSQRLDRQQNNRFLKKGSSVQKQIVINLLRNKLLRSNQNINNPQDSQKYNSKDAIIQMIKLYKGGPMKNDTSQKRKEKQAVKTQKLINGWQYKNDETFTKQNIRQKSELLQI